MDGSEKYFAVYCRNPKDIDDLPALIELIKLDPALCLKTIQLANIVAGHSPQSTPSFESLVHFVGVDAIREMAAYHSAQAVKGRYDYCAPEILEKFWLHSVKSAFIAQYMATELRYQDPESADSPPGNQVALGFTSPHVIAFLEFDDQGPVPPAGLVALLKKPG